MKNGFTFEGFEPANTTPVPDFLFDVLLAHLSESELKVLLYIIRRTNGFKKPADAISLTQFQKGIKKRATGEVLDEGCGIGDRTTIVKALAALEKKGCIQCEKGNDPQGDKAVSVYRIKFRSDGVVGKPDHPSEEGSGQTRPPWWAQPTTVVGRTNHRVVGKPDLQETVLQETESQETVLQEGTYGADAPTPAHLLKEVDEKLEEVEELQRITGEHPAVKPTDTESHYHIAVSAIGNEEDEPVLSAPRLTLPSKGQSHAQPADLSRRGVRGPDSGPDHRVAHRLDDTSQQAPGTAALPPAAAVTDTVGRKVGISSVQATSAPLVPLPAQATSPPAGSVEPAPTVQASGFTPPKRPRQPRPPAMPPAPPTITLTPQEKAFWGLWCNLFFNKDIEPELTMTAYGHVRKLAPHITSAEQLESLVKKARQDLEENTGVKRKTVYLGNCVNSYPGWKQEQQAAQGPPEEKPMDKYTAASRDKERNERNMQRLRDMIIAEGGELPQ